MTAINSITKQSNKKESLGFKYTGSNAIVYSRSFYNRKLKDPAALERRKRFKLASKLACGLPIRPTLLPACS